LLVRACRDLRTTLIRPVDRSQAVGRARAGTLPAAYEEQLVPAEA